MSIINLFKQVLVNSGFHLLNFLPPNGMNNNYYFSTRSRKTKFWALHGRTRFNIFDPVVLKLPSSLLYWNQVPIHRLFGEPNYRASTPLSLFPLKRNMFLFSSNILLTQRDKHVREAGITYRRRLLETCEITQPEGQWKRDPLCRPSQRAYFFRNRTAKKRWSCASPVVAVLLSKQLVSKIWRCWRHFYKHSVLIRQ